MATIELESSDPNANLVAPGGEALLQRNGVVEVPERYAQFAEECVRPRTIFRRRTRAFAGFDAEELAAQYAEWEKSRG